MIETPSARKSRRLSDLFSKLDRSRSKYPRVRQPAKDESSQKSLIEYSRYLSAIVTTAFVLSVGIQNIPTMGIYSPGPISPPGGMR
jgi:hypothetical protein